MFEGRNTLIGEAVDDYTKSKAIKSYWLGIHDKVTEGTFVYASDQMPIGSQNNWNDGQPNDYTGQDCVVVKQEWNGKWDDRQCSDARAFVCVRSGKVLIQITI